MADIVYMSKKAWTALLDAIRAKSGHSGTLTASGAKAAVDSIETGGGAQTYDYPLAALERTKSAPTIDPTATKISDSVFTNYNELTSISLPDSIETIGQNAFSGCSNLTLSTLPASLKTLGSGAFANSGISVSALPEGLTTIGDMCFQMCANIESVVIPASVTSLGFGIWSPCTGLKSVTVNPAIALDSWTFSDCKLLSKIIINGSASIAGDTFGGATAETGAMVIRYADGIVQLTSEYNHSYNPDLHIGTSTFPVYVPDALLDSYKTATNWSKIADNIRALSTYTEA